MDGGGGAGIWDLGTTGKTKLNLARQLREVQGWGPEKGYRHWAPQTGHKINKTKAKFFFPLLFFFLSENGRRLKKTKDVSSPFSYFSTLRSVGVAGPQRRYENNHRCGLKLQSGGERSWSSPLRPKGYNFHPLELSLFIM